MISRRKGSRDEGSEEAWTVGRGAKVKNALRVRFDGGGRGREGRHRLRKDEGKWHSSPDRAGVGMSPDDSVLLVTIAKKMPMDGWRA